MQRKGPQPGFPDGVDLDLVMELVELQTGPNPGYDLVALVLGVSTASLTRYRHAQRVPRDVAEDLYDRIARGLGVRKPKKFHWEWPMDLDERSELARKHWKGHAA